MKKILVVLLVGLMTLSLVACEEETDTDNKSSSTTTSSSGSSDDDKETKTNKSDNSEKITLEAVLSHDVTPEGDFNFSEDGNGNSGVLSYSGSDSIVVIPETYEGLPVTKIETGAFSNKEGEKAIKFSDTVTEIDYGACGLNKGLEIVVMGSGTKLIGQSAFLECSSLKEVVLNEGLEKISTSAFANCPNLKSITIPESVVEIEFGAFTGTNDIIIYGIAGSAAEKFAKESGIEFIAK